MICESENLRGQLTCYDPMVHYTWKTISPFDLLRLYGRFLEISILQEDSWNKLLSSLAQRSMRFVTHTSNPMLHDRCSEYTHTPVLGKDTCLKEPSKKKHAYHVLGHAPKHSRVCSRPLHPHRIMIPAFLKGSETDGRLALIASQEER